MAPDTKTDIASPPTEIVCPCPPSHRRLRFVLTFIVAALVIAVVGCLIYLRVTGGLNP